MEFNPKLKTYGVFNVDGSLTVVGGRTGRPAVSLNTANANSWSAQQTFNSTAQFNSLANFSSTVQLNSSTYQYGNLFNYGGFYNYGTFYTTWTPGSIPFIGSSNQLTYDYDDFFRDLTLKRYGFGIGYGDSLLAKVHSVGSGSCSGTPTACGSYSDSSACGAASGCFWTSYGSCYVFGDESSCNAQQGCLWSSGMDCSTIGDEMTCNATSPCSWQTSYSNCSEIGDEMTCNSAGGGGYCSWQMVGNTCPSYGDESSCNMASPCSWYQPTSNCSDIFDESSCNNAGGGGYCSWNGSSCDGSTYPNGSPYCSGDNSYSYCSGSTYPSGASCTGGTFGAGCNENYYCGGIATPCESYTTVETCLSPCSWGQELAGYFDGGGQWGVESSDKNGWWGATPVAQSTGWSATGGYSALKTFAPGTVTLSDLARVVATMLDQMKTYGIFGS